MGEPRKINRMFGEQPVHAEPGLARWRYVVREEHFNPAGALHGGVLSTLLDGAMGHALWTIISAEEGPGAFSAAITLNVTFLSSMRTPGATLTIEGRVVKRGKRIGFTEGIATDEAGVELARATSSYAILKR